MERMIIRCLACVFVWGCIMQAIAQKNQAVLEVLRSKSSFEDIKSVIDSAYQDRDLTKNRKEYSEYKWWQRWLWTMGSHLQPSGEPTNLAAKHWNEYQDALRNSESTRSNSGSWSPKGPFSVDEGVARADRIAFHPTDPNIIYAGTPAGGLFRTLDGGTTWGPLNGHMPNVGVSGIAVDKDEPNTLYVLTGDGDSFIPPGGFVWGFGYIRQSIGVLKSTNGGATWQLLSAIDSTSDFYGYKLIQLADFHYRMFACTSSGLYRSNDYGATWVRDNNIGNQPVYDIEDAGSGYVYATTTFGLYVSSNWGNPFSAVSSSAYNVSPPTNADRVSVAVSPAAPNTVYILFGGNGTDKLYRSDNNGTSFTLVNASPPTTQQYMAGFAVSPIDINTMIIGEVIIERSMNGGVSFGVVGGSVHADVHDIQWNPLDNVVYIACDGGMYKSYDHGLNWFSCFHGIHASQFYHMTGVEGNNNIIMAGAQDNGILESSNSGASYRLDWGGDGFDTKFINGNANRCYISVNESIAKIQLNPFDWEEKTPPGASGFYPTLAIHPSIDTIIYAGYSSGVYRSDNDGDTWTNKGAKGSNGGTPAGGLVVSPNAPDRVYTADHVTVWRSNYRGDTWTVISGNPGFPSTSTATPITDMKSRVNNADEIWITLGGYSAGNKVFYSSDGGSTWHNFSGSLPNTPVHCIAYSSEGDAYIGTDLGVYFMDFAMSDWVPYSNGLPLVPVSDLFINESQGILLASTFGRGNWQSDLYTDCGPFMLLSGVTWGRNFYQSNGFIETQQVIPGSVGNELRLRSPVRITLENNFKVERGAYLHAVIGNCGQGNVSLTAPSPGKAVSKTEAIHLPHTANDRN